MFPVDVRTDYFMVQYVKNCGLRALNGLEFLKEKALNCVGQ